MLKFPQVPGKILRGTLGSLTWQRTRYQQDCFTSALLKFMKVSYPVPDYTNLLINRLHSPQQFSIFSRGTQSTRSDDSPSQVHYHERPSSVGLRTVYFLRWYQVATYSLASAYFPGCPGR